MEIAKQMHKPFNNQLPQRFQTLFTKIEQIHFHETKPLKKRYYFLPRVTANPIVEIHQLFEGLKYRPGSEK